MDVAALEDGICDNIRKGDRAIKFEVMRHGLAGLQAILGAEESIKGFMQRGDD